MRLAPNRYETAVSRVMHCDHASECGVSDVFYTHLYLCGPHLEPVLPALSPVLAERPR